MTMHPYRSLLTLVALAAICVPAGAESAKPAASERPNIVIILADDFGYGSAGCYGATKLKTPNLDRLAQEGVRFTDANCPNSMCTPTRYALLTGEYCWRNPAYKRYVLGATDPLLISTERQTLASMVKSFGYHTACIGKWHLGFGIEKPDWNGELKPGPLELGFDSYFGIPVNMNGYPNVFVKDHRVYKLDPKDPLAGKSGGVAARLDYDHISRDLANEAIGFIEQHQKEPFFLYFPMNQVHHPIHPAPQFKGTSEVGRYGDYIHDLDWSVGQVLETLDRLDLNKKTLVIFTSDNGAYDKGQKAGSAPGMDEDVPDESAFNFKRNAPWSGYKVGVLMGGYRVPFLVRWTNRVPSGKTSDNLVCLTDIYATLAELLGYSIVPGNAPDSISFLTELLNRDQKPASQTREAMVYQSGPGYFGVREKNWALVLEIKESKWKGPEQLFDLSVDPQQKNNVSQKHPEVVTRLRGIFDVIKGSGQASETRDAKRKP